MESTKTAGTLTYFPTVAQGMESTETAAYSNLPSTDALGSGSTYNYTFIKIPFYIYIIKERKTA